MVAPEPLADCSAELELLVKNEMFADAAPEAVGVNVTVYGTLCPVDKVSGGFTPASVNAELLELVDDSVTLPPVAVRLPLWVCVLPMATLPKFIALGATLRVPLEVVPLPVSEMDTDGSEALEASVSVALLVPQWSG
jgi:hypothetical protein